MFTNKQRHCYVKSSALDPSYVQVVHPTLFDSDRFHNETMCAFDEFYFSMVDEPMIKKLAQATRTLYMEDLTLKFSNIAQEYSRQVKELHDNTMKSLRDACLEVAKSIDDEITWRFAIEPGNERTKAAQNATLTNVFGYNERAQQRRDQELREEFRLRLSRSNAAELSTQELELEPAPVPASPPELETLDGLTPGAAMLPILALERRSTCHLAGMRTMTVATLWNARLAARREKNRTPAPAPLPETPGSYWDTFNPAILEKATVPAAQSKSPLSFLSSRLSKFTKATRIFTTRDYTHTNVAAEFHQACDNIPNTLVIIKSGQYIAGGYTEVAWSSPPFKSYGSSPTAFLFSVQHGRIYSVTYPVHAILNEREAGPQFGEEGDALKVWADYCDQSKEGDGGMSSMESYDTSQAEDPNRELLGMRYFTIDEYEVYKLE